MDLKRSCLLSGMEQLKKVKIDKSCLKIVCFGNCSLLYLVSNTQGASEKQTLDEQVRKTNV